MKLIVDIKNYLVGTTKPVQFKFATHTFDVGETVGTMDPIVQNFSVTYTGEVGEISAQIVELWIDGVKIAEASTPPEMTPGATYEVSFGVKTLGAPVEPDPDLDGDDAGPDMEPFEPEVPSATPAPPYATPTPGTVAGPGTVTSPYPSGGTVGIGSPGAAPGFGSAPWNPYSSGGPGSNPDTDGMTKQDFYDVVRQAVDDSGSVAVPAGEGVEYGALEGSEGDEGLGDSIEDFLDAAGGLREGASGVVQAFGIEMPTFGGRGDGSFTIVIMGEEFEVDVAKVPMLGWIRSLAYLALLTAGFFTARAIIRGAFVDQS